ncbi:hypothetical protein [Actinomyces sp. zg328]|uniref:hypothetical protein n=1 Tax=Actinomyces sp. zg328 TaxID=2609287 RepID=UPI00135B1B41|nr:hypothetical protein [Actinomyces sp. zg328]
MDIAVSDATAVRRAPASSQLGLSITTKLSDIASTSVSVLAINGAHYGFHETGALTHNGMTYRAPAHATGEGVRVRVVGGIRPHPRPRDRGGSTSPHAQSTQLPHRPRGQGPTPR